MPLLLQTKYKMWLFRQTWYNVSKSWNNFDGFLCECFLAALAALVCVFGPLAPPVPTRMLYCKASCISACPDIFVWHVFCFSNPSVHISEEIFFFTSPPLLQICSFPPCLTLCCSFSTKSWFSWQYRNEFDLLHPELWPNMFINVFLPLSFYSLTRLVLSPHTLILLKWNWVKGRSMGILSQSFFFFLLGSHPAHFSVPQLQNLTKVLLRLQQMLSSIPPPTTFSLWPAARWD